MLHYLFRNGTRQRFFYKQEKLSAEKQKTLEQLPGWVWGERKSRGITWSDSLKYLQEYVKHEGHSSVPFNHITEDGYNLGAWVRDQRYYYKKVKRKLSAEKQKMLKQLPGWVWGEEKKRGTWEESFEYLRKYARSEGHTSVPLEYVTEDGYNLGAWVANQRVFYKQEKLSTERQKMLEQLPGWVWRIRKSRTITWSDALKYLQEYIKREGQASVPHKYVTEDGCNLGVWVANQRFFYKQGKLSAERRKTLEQLPGWVWNTRKTINKNDG